MQLSIWVLELWELPGDFRCTWDYNCYGTQCMKPRVTFIIKKISITVLCKHKSIDNMPTWYHNKPWILEVIKIKPWHNCFPAAERKKGYDQGKRVPRPHPPWPHQRIFSSISVLSLTYPPASWSLFSGCCYQRPTKGHSSNDNDIQTTVCLRVRAE